LHYTASGIITPIGVMIPDDEHMVLETCRALNKLIVKQKFCASSWLITEIKLPYSFALKFFSGIKFLENYIGKNIDLFMSNFRQSCMILTKTGRCEEYLSVFLEYDIQ